MSTSLIIANNTPLDNAIQYLCIYPPRQLNNNNNNFLFQTTENESPNTYDWTELMCAAYCKQWNTVQLLISNKGIDAKYSSPSNGWNVLHCAAKQGAPDEIIILLIEAGVDITKKNNQGQTPADIARTYFHIDAAIFIDEIINRPLKSAKFLA
jgi:ankyrin repeat protein